jgi:hypothetical protein
MGAAWLLEDGQPIKEVEMKALSVSILKFAEVIYLHAHGWKKVGKDTWTPPPNYGRPNKVGKQYRGGHAVNSQRYTNGLMAKLGRRQVPDPDVEDEEYETWGTRGDGR